MKTLRNHISFVINGSAHKVFAEQAFLNLAEYLRYQAAQTGTKIVCAEGDCGACTVLVANTHDHRPQLKTVNSCIQPVFNLDGCVVVTVEALQATKALCSVQQAMVDNHGAQCGYCTPGICMSLSYMSERAKTVKTPMTAESAKNFLTGNLCRCTGYEPILKAACSLDFQSTENLSQRFLTGPEVESLKAAVMTDVFLKIESANEQNSLQVSVPATRASLLPLLGKGRLTSGATDLGVQRNKGRLRENNFISLQKINDIKSVEVSANQIRVGAGATWDVIQDVLLADFPEFAESINLFASPQIKHIGTLAGNVMNASPIADGIPFLMVNEAELVLLNSNGTERRVSINDFYQGYKKTLMAKDEMLSEIVLLKNSFKQKIYKVSQRKDLDIATINVAIAYSLQDGVISSLRLAFGGVAETSLRLKEAESLAVGRKLDRDLAKDIANVIERSIKPLSDVRGSSQYRMILAKNLIYKWIAELETESVESNQESGIQI